MKYKLLEFPGNTTIYEENPEVTIIRHETSRPDLSIKYNSKEWQRIEDKTIATLVLLTFFSVYEYRWVDFDLDYSHFDNDDYVDDRLSGFSLVEIDESNWIKMMRAKSYYLQTVKLRPEQLPEVQIIHYRMCFDDYGTFDILAHSFTSEEIVEEV